MKKSIIRIAVLSLAVMMFNCGDFLSGGILDSDPNSADKVPLESLFVATQAVNYGFYTTDIGVLSCLFMQQTAGVAHQYIDYENYFFTNGNFAFFGQMYQEGGLIDIATIKEIAVEEEKPTIAAITKIYEALLFATGADAWGDIPYTEANDPDIEHPHYDNQESVHDACIALLDQAIAELGSADEFFDDSNDFSFGGDRQAWIRAANSLKARILLNWAEVHDENYGLALTAAQSGINSNDGSWVAPFRDVVDEQNPYYQFFYNRGDNIRVGKHFMDLFIDSNDPRKEFYFGLDDNGGYSGSEHSSFSSQASWFNPSTFGSPGWDLDILSYEENLFMIAECEFQTGDEAGALATLNDALGVIENRWGFEANSIQRYSGLSGDALLEAIMNEKYKALFLNMQTWNDWKRTGYPAIVSLDPEGKDIPRRFLYPSDEENTNDNFPGILGMWTRNANDPG